MDKLERFLLWLTEDVMPWVLTAVVLMLVAVTCCSCVTKREVVEKPVVVEKVVRDTVRDTKVIRTTERVVVRDSVAPNDKGGIDRWHGEWSEKGEKVHDTVYIHKTDSVPKVVRVTTTKEKKVMDVKAMGVVGGIGIVVGVLGVVGVLWYLRRVKR